MGTTIFSGDIGVKLAVGIDMADITGDLEALVNDAGIRTGTLFATMTGSTGSLTAIEKIQCLPSRCT